MKKIVLWIFIGLLFPGCESVSKPPAVGHVGQYGTREAFLRAIEKGEGGWKDFVDAVRQHAVQFRDVSPSAVANYMEAFANEGMLSFIPSQYLQDEEIKTALEVVFEDPSNIEKNRDFYRRI